MCYVASPRNNCYMKLYPAQIVNAECFNKYDKKYAIIEKSWAEMLYIQYNSLHLYKNSDKNK